MNAVAQSWGIMTSSLDLCPDKTKEASIRKWLIDQDIRKLEMSSLLLPANIQRIPTAQGVVVEGPIFAQVVKVTDTTKPTRKSDEGEELIQQGPKGLLVLSLTDGTNKFDFVDTLDTPALTVKTAPPGTKLLLTGKFSVVNGLLFPGPGKIEVLGGKVEKLFEAWQANLAVKEKRESTLAVNSKISGETPPKFVSFSERKIEKRSVPILHASQPPPQPQPAQRAPRFQAEGAEKPGFLASHKLGVDAFASHQKSEKQRRPRTSRFEAKDTEREYAPPARATSAGLAAFIKVDKSEDAETAQLIRDLAAIEEMERPAATRPDVDTRRGRGRGRRFGTR